MKIGRDMQFDGVNETGYGATWKCDFMGSYGGI